MVATLSTVGVCGDKIRTGPLAVSIARELGVQILSGSYKPGDLIDGELDACKHLRVSRATYREALHILAAKGLVERRQRAGTKVTHVESWNWLDPDMLAWSFESDGGGRSLANLFELRRTIEPEAAALAANRRTQENIVEMQRALESMRLSISLMKHGDLALRQFRAALFRASCNLYFGTMGQVIDRSSALMDAYSLAGVSGYSDQVGYGDVLDAIDRRDSSRAKQVMSEVIDRAWTYVSASFNAARMSNAGAQKHR